MNKQRLIPGVGPVVEPGLYLTTRPGAAGAPPRFFFQPPGKYRADGWAAVRLYHEPGWAIATQEEAEERCRALADVFRRWQQGEAGYGPRCIDKLGRLVESAGTFKPAPGRRKEPTRGRYLPAQIGAMVADFRRHEIFLERSKKTQTEYRIYLNQLVDKFGDRHWRELSPAVLRKWFMERAEIAPSGAHQLYRTVRAFFGKVKFIYPENHPGFVGEEANPARRLSLPTPKPVALPWPAEAVAAMVAIADREGEPSIGDAVTIMAWLGVRRQDWFRWPAAIFDAPELAFRQRKTGAPNVLPWGVVPAIVQRVEAAKVRRRQAVVQSPFFFTDRDGKPWVNERSFWEAFNRLRDVLAAERPHFRTNYFVDRVPGHPLALPTRDLTVRTLRHTCVTLNFDAGVPADAIGGLTGHTTQEVHQILKHYRRRTADQAKTALLLRLDHEGKDGGAKGRVSTVSRN